MSGMIGGLLGLFGGLLFGGFGWWYGRKKARQNRGLDERYELVTKKALARGWQITFAGMFIFYFLILIGVNIKPIQLISFLYIIHMVGWAGARFYYEARY